MEHTDAILSNAVERYLLDEMTEDEQRIFEEHYFDCPACAADVTDGTRMMMTGRVVTAGEAETSNVIPMPVDRLRWLPSAAAASLIFGLLGSGVGYRVAQQQQDHPEQHDPPTELVRVVRVDTGKVRGGAMPVGVPTVGAGDELQFDIESRDDAARYAVVVKCGGDRKSTHDISREMAADDISLRIGELPPGRCDLVIEGVRKDGNRFPITSSPFEVGERSRLEGETGVR